MRDAVLEMTLPAPQFRSIPTHELLEGFARLHPFVLLAGQKGRVEWMSPELRRHLCEDPALAHLGAAGHDHLIPTLKLHLPHPEQLDALRGDLVTHGRAGARPLDLATAEGAMVRVEASAFVVGAPGSEPSHYVVFARPASEPDHPEPVASPNDDLLAQIVESSPQGILATDASGYVRHANAAAAAMLGRTVEKLVGQPLAAFLPRSKDVAELLEKLREPSGWNEEEIEQTDASGRRSWISVSTRPLRDADGSSCGLLAYLRDVTARRELHELLASKNQELESYVDSVAHDLRSPLVSLLGFTGLLREDYASRIDETGRHFLERVEAAGRTMDRLIHDLLELARIRRPSDAVELADPRRVLLQVESELKLRLEAEQVRLVLPDDPPLVRVDGTRLYQVFSNLIGNAMRHAFQEGQGGLVEVEVHERAGEHEIEVRDDGRGIAESDLERIFGVFQTGRRVRKNEHSHGIGLAIVKKIAEAYGGRVWVESTPGIGSSFHVVIPR